MHVYIIFDKNLTFGVGDGDGVSVEFVLPLELVLPGFLGVRDELSLVELLGDMCDDFMKVVAARGRLKINRTFIARCQR